MQLPDTSLTGNFDILRLVSVLAFLRHPRQIATTRMGVSWKENGATVTSADGIRARGTEVSPSWKNS